MATVTGGKAIRNRLGLIEKNVRRQISDELDDIAQEILVESRRLAPQLTGRMIASSGTDKDDRPQRFRRSIFYDIDYAVFQHEGFFQPGPVTIAKDGAGRKFLQRPYEKKRRDLIRRIGVATERGLRVSLR